MTSAPIIAVRDLRKSFGSLEVLSGVTLEVHYGEVMVIIGPSGSGKTTLLRCLSFLEEYDAGDIFFDGQLVGYRDDASHRVRDSEASVSALRAQMGMVFQHFHLWPHKTVLENVIEGLVVVKKTSATEARKIGVELLGKVGMLDKADVYPSKISGGQMQRAAIARALAMEPKALLFDEPTSALDPELVGEVLDVMKQLASEGTTMVVVSHEIGFAREVADRIVMMDEGRIVEVGVPTEILQNPGHERTRSFLSKVLH